MNVTDFPIEKRLQLYNKWLQDRDSATANCFDAYICCGNVVDLTVKEIKDPDYIIPEWKRPLPYWIKEYVNKIGSWCKIDNTKGLFVGYSYDYTDFYYRILTSKGITLFSCVGKIKFLTQEEILKDENEKT